MIPQPGTENMSSCSGPNGEGAMAVHTGDWIITGVVGERYSCKKKIFEASYERVVEEDPHTIVRGRSA